MIVSLLTSIIRYKLLREMSASKGAEGKFTLSDIGVQQTKEYSPSLPLPLPLLHFIIFLTQTLPLYPSYFLEALRLNPTNRMALCSFAEFSAQCGDFQTAEEFFLRTLEVDPKYSYALLQYGNFLCRRDIKMVAQMFLEKGGRAAGSQSAIDALTGKQVSGAVGVMFPDNTKKTVNATPAMTSLDLMVSLKNISIHRMGHSESKIETEVRGK